MKNPIISFRETQNKIKTVKTDILTKKQEIQECKNQVDEIKSEKSKTNFKWYDIKTKANFNDEIKDKKKFIKEKISELEKELNTLEKEYAEVIDKRNKTLFWICISTFIIFSIITITVGSIKEKTNPDILTTTVLSETTSEISTVNFTDKNTETTTNDAYSTTFEVTTKEYTTERKTEQVTETTTLRTQKIVYGSRTGNHYHNGSCRYANGAQMTIAEAEKKGWNPCSVCNP